MKPKFGAGDLVVCDTLYSGRNTGVILEVYTWKKVVGYRRWFKGSDGKRRKYIVEVDGVDVGGSDYTSYLEELKLQPEYKVLYPCDDGVKRGIYFWQDEIEHYNLKGPCC